MEQHLLLILGVMAVISAAADEPSAARPKKLIVTGWDNPTTAQLRRDIATMEQWPFDGAIIEAVAVGAPANVNRLPLRETFSRGAWKREWFVRSIADLKAARSAKLTDLFVTVLAQRGDADWFDDDAWRDVVEHWRIAAWIAKQGGAKGILFDPEPYTEPFEQFNYAKQEGREKHSYAQYWAKARERGRAVMRAIAEEFPDAVVFTYRLLCDCWAATGRADPREALMSHTYGLFVPFFDGWLDVLPPTMTIVEGTEDAYLFNDERQFLEAVLTAKGAAQELVSPENRAKYRAQVQVGFGIYLDAYINPEGSPWYVDGKGGPRVERLRQNVASALRMADEYVWIYGEQGRWWPDAKDWAKWAGEQQFPPWPQVLPRADQMLAKARDPIAWARRQIQHGQLINRARNGDFSAAAAAVNEQPAADWQAEGNPSGWSHWQEEQTSRGDFAWDREVGSAGRGSARMSGVDNGCFIQTYAVRPNEEYAIAVSIRARGRGAPYVLARWQTEAGKWTAWERDAQILPQKREGEWREYFGIARVPEGAGRLVLLLGVRGQFTAEDTVWFDDAQVYCLP